MQQDNSGVQSCIRYIKDTILKAIYNTAKVLVVVMVLYSVYQRYNFESNLQHIRQQLYKVVCCIRYIKDTILKAIYNHDVKKVVKTTAVFGISKIQF